VKSIVCGDVPKGSIPYPHALIPIKAEISVQNVLSTKLSSALPLDPVTTRHSMYQTVNSPPFELFKECVLNDLWCVLW